MIEAAQLWTVLAKSHRAVRLLVERSVAAAGLCLSDFAALEALLHKGPLTISQIQAKVLLASGSMTATVDRLEDKGLIVRNTTSEDRRARVVALTPKGRDLIEQVFAKHSADLDQLIAVLDAGERRQLYELLKKLGLFAAESLEQQRSALKVSK